MHFIVLCTRQCFGNIYYWVAEWKEKTNCWKKLAMFCLNQLKTCRPNFHQFVCIIELSIDFFSVFNCCYVGYFYLIYVRLICYLRYCCRHISSIVSSYSVCLQKERENGVPNRGFSKLTCLRFVRSHNRICIINFRFLALIRPLLLNYQRHYVRAKVFDSLGIYKCRQCALSANKKKIVGEMMAIETTVMRPDEAIQNYMSRQNKRNEKKKKLKKTKHLVGGCCLPQFKREKKNHIVITHRTSLPLYVRTSAEIWTIRAVLFCFCCFSVADDIYNWMWLKIDIVHINWLLVDSVIGFALISWNSECTESSKRWRVCSSLANRAD